MGRRIQTEPNRPARSIRPALNPDAREKQMINLATNLAEQQLLDGTASSQVIVHYLKLGTERERLERERLEKENELLRAKTEALENSAHSDELYARAINAFKGYRGTDIEEGGIQ